MNEINGTNYIDAVEIKWNNCVVFWIKVVWEKYQYMSHFTVKAEYSIFVIFLNVLLFEKSEIKCHKFCFIFCKWFTKRFRFVSESKATEFTDVHDPATNELLCRTPKSTKEEMEMAVKSTKEAYEKWKNTSILTRQTLMLRYQALIREHSVSL